MPEKKSLPAGRQGKLAVIKTKPTAASVEDFINKVPQEQKRKDSFVLLDLMKKASGEEPVLWSNSIIGFGIKRYKSPATGREVDWLKIGFCPRKANMTLYIGVGAKEHTAALKKLGKYKTAGGCLYVNKLEDIDLKVLKGIINASLNKK